jgi:hypothetical protein
MSSLGGLKLPYCCSTERKGHTFTPLHSSYKKTLIYTYDMIDGEETKPFEELRH